MILIKSFITGVLHDCSKLIYAYLNEGNKIHECYSCLKMMMQAHLHVSFFTICLVKRESLKQLYLYLKLLQSRTFLNKKLIMRCLALQLLHAAFYNS